MRIGVYGVIGLGLLTAACGTTETQRAATGGLTGIGVGALVGGPIGAVAGGLAGGAVGAVMPEGAETLAINAVRQEKTAANSGLKSIGLEQPAQGSSTAPAVASNQPAGRRAGQQTAETQSAQMIKKAQVELKHEGLYRGRIDGINGPATQEALVAFQKREGLQQTAQLDQDTLQRMNLAAAGPQTAQGANANQASGTSTPQQQPMMSATDIRNRLQAEGYGNISNVQHHSDNTYTARAERGNQAYDLRVDARSGQVVSQQSVAANQQQGGTSANSGSSAGSSSNPNANAPSTGSGNMPGENSGNQTNTGNH